MHQVGNQYTVNVTSGVTSLSATLVHLFVIRALIAIIEFIREANTSLCTILHAHKKLCIDTLTSERNVLTFVRKVSGSESGRDYSKVL